MSNARLRIVRILLISFMVLAAVGIAATPAAADGNPCEVGYYSGGQYLICMPPGGLWNGDLVVYAHGYVAPGNPIAIPQDQLALPGGPSIPETVTGLGYAFAATSYRTNGLAVKEGVEDLVDLVNLFKGKAGVPETTYLVGASEGGLITALSTERYPHVFDGGLATCGPVGDFRQQITYWGDVRVLFDYFFPGALPRFKPLRANSQAPAIPQAVIDRWYCCGDPERNPNYGCAPAPAASYEMRVRAALMAKPDATRQLLQVANVPVNPGDFEANVEALVELLWYNVFSTNDAMAKLGGQPYDNTGRWYSGSDNDHKLNKKIARFEADPAALTEIQNHYQTSGALTVPVVTLHTVLDPVVPYWHEPIYEGKVLANDAQALHTNIPILRYGHCNFEVEEVLFAFGVLRYQVSGEPPW